MSRSIKTAVSRKAIEAAAQASLRQKTDGLAPAVFMGTSTDPAKVQPLGPLNVEKMLESVENLIHETWRNRITVVVRVPHFGPVLKQETPEDGSRWIMSYHQANEVHKEWPLHLSKIVSRFEAEFIPVSVFAPTFVSRRLPPPPWGLQMNSTPETDDTPK